MMTRPVALVLVAALIGSFASPLDAQTLPVKTGDKIVVTTIAGWEMKGVVSDTSQTTIDVSGETGTKKINVSDVRKIDTSDSLRNGFLWGLGLSAGGALVPAFMVTKMTCPAIVTGPGQCTYPKVSTGERIGVFVGFTAAACLLYCSVAVLIDRHIDGRRTIYEKASTSASVHVEPIVTKNRFGFSGSIRW